MQAEILRKITLKTVGFDKAGITDALGDQKSVELCRVVGVTTNAAPGQTDLGEFLKLHGQFRAINVHTGEVFESTVAILPNFIAQSLAAALEGSSEVEFGLSIGAKTAKSVTGYEFTVRPLVEAKPSDKMAALIAVAGMDRPLLIGGDKAEGKAPAKATKRAA